MTLSTALAKRNARPYYWVEIDGIAERYGMLETGSDPVYDAFNPSEAGGNLVTNGSAIDDASWTKNGATVTANATTAPDGTATADKIRDTSSTAYVYQDGSVSPNDGDTVVWGGFFRAIDRDWIRLRIDSGGTLKHACYFDLGNAAVGTEFDCTGIIKRIDENWVYCAIKCEFDAYASPRFFVWVADGDNDTSLVGSPLDAYYVWKLAAYPQTTRPINRLLSAIPKIGKQEIDVLKCQTKSATLAFELLDYNDRVTALLEYPDEETRLTSSIGLTDKTINVEDVGDLSDSGDVFVDGETIWHHSKVAVSRSITGVATISSTTTSLGALLFVYGRGKSLRDSSSFLDRGVNYWRGAVVTIGANSRTVSASWLDSDGNTVLEFTKTFPSQITSGTSYTITAPPRGMIISPVSSVSDNHFVGGRIEITSGTNSGEKTFVVGYDSAKGLLEVKPAFSAPCDATTSGTLYQDMLLGCERGMHDSEVTTHTVTNPSGGLARRYVNTNVPWLKQRGFAIKMSCVGEAESEALTFRGVIREVKQTKAMTSYQISGDGLIAQLTRNLMRDVAVTKLDHIPIWGGYVIVDIDKRRVNGKIQRFPKWRFSTSGGETGTYNSFIHGRGDNGEFASRGNIKVNDEIIHYLDVRDHYFTDGTVGSQFFLTEDKTLAINNAYRWIQSQREASVYACFGNRAVLHEIIGAPKIRREPMFLTKGDQSAADKYKPEPLTPEVSALMAEHSSGSEMRQCMVLSDTYQSDMPRVDRLYYTSVSGDIESGETVTGGTSGVTSTVLLVETYYVDVISSEPTDEVYTWGEALTFSGGATATENGFEARIRIRNNVIDVLLALMTSSGEVGSNGAYDMLPKGFGIGVPQEWIDFESFEALRDTKFGHVQLNGYLDEPVSFREFFEKHIARLYQIAIVERSDGKLGLIEMATTEQAKVFDELGLVETIDADEISQIKDPSWSIGQEPIAKFEVQYNRSTDGSHLNLTEIYFDTANEWHRQRGQNVEIELDYLYLTDTQRRIAHNDPAMPVGLRRMCQVTLDRFARNPAPVIKVMVDFRHVLLQVGDVVSLTESRTPNVRNGTIGYSSSYHQVIALEHDYKSSAVTLTLMQIGTSAKRYGRVAPAGKITAWNSGTKTITIESNSFTDSRSNRFRNARDSDSFAVGDKIQVFDSSLSNSGDVLEVQSVSGDDIVVDVVPASDTPTAGGYITYADYDDCTSSQKNTRVFMSDENETLGAATDAPYYYE